MANSIAIYSGEIFDLENPHLSEFTIVDVAHALSHICRFTGHCNKFYSVAQHSVYVSRLCSPENRLYGLLHDAPEAFIGDVSSPLKRLLPDYRNIEENVTKAVNERFGLPLEEPPEVKVADLRMLATERLALINSPLDEDKWAFLKNFEFAPFPVEPMNPSEAKLFFLSEYLKLVN
jgi:hypothetical protein